MASELETARGMVRVPTGTWTVDPFTPPWSSVSGT